MSKDIRIQKTVYNKGEFDKVVDRSFKTYLQPVPEAQVPTISEFFQLYEQLYLEIPVRGSTQSHEYLVQRSSELTDFEKDTSDIQPLLEEIAQLREQILNYQNQIIALSQTS